MMKQNRRIILYVVYVLCGIMLCGFGYAGMIDEFWNGMGSALLVIGVLRLLRIYRFQKDESYREKLEIETQDERNRFLRNKAWAWSGYLFIIIVGISVIVLKIMGQELLSIAACYAVCLMMILYWISYMILNKKY